MKMENLKYTEEADFVGLKEYMMDLKVFSKKFAGLTRFLFSACFIQYWLLLQDAS